MYITLTTAAILCAIIGAEEILVGIIRNASLIAAPSNMTISRSTCHDCECAMLIPLDSFTILSLNCFTLIPTGVICQLFTLVTYLLPQSYQMVLNESSTYYFRQLPPANQTMTIEDAVESTTLAAMTTTERPIVTLTRPGDPIIGLYNTTAGGPIVGKDGRYSYTTEHPSLAIDNSTSTKYFNFGGTGDVSQSAHQPGVGSGFYVTPSISNATVAIGLLFATADGLPNRDPLSVTLEGSNLDALDLGSSWTLIYNGSTGIYSSADPGRQVYASPQYFNNAIPFRSYRLLVTSQRGDEHGVQYSEARILGYV